MIHFKGICIKLSIKKNRSEQLRSYKFNNNFFMKQSVDIKNVRKRIILSKILLAFSTEKLDHVHFDFVFLKR